MFQNSARRIRDLFVDETCGVVVFAELMCSSESTFMVFVGFYVFHGIFN